MTYTMILAFQFQFFVHFMIHSLDIGGQIFYHIHTSCDKHCVATLRYKYKLRVKSKDSERSHGDPTNTMYVTLHTVNLNTANKSKHC